MDYTLKVGEVLSIGPLTHSNSSGLVWKLLSDGAIEEVERKFTPAIYPANMTFVREPDGELFITVRALRPGTFTLIRVVPYDSDDVKQRLTGEVVLANPLAPPAPPEPEEESMLVPAAIGIGALVAAWFLYRRRSTVSSLDGLSGMLYTLRSESDLTADGDKVLFRGKPVQRLYVGNPNELRLVAQGAFQSNSPEIEKIRAMIRHYGQIELVDVPKRRKKR